MPADMLIKLPGYGADVESNQAQARKIMEGLGYSADKPLTVKVSTRNIAIYRDPAVILIDQLKKIHIAGELEVVDTSIWHAKVARKDYAVGLNLTGVGVDDPDKRDFIRPILRDGIKKGAQKGVDSAIESFGLDSEVEDALKSVIEAGMKTKPGE